MADLISLGSNSLKTKDLFFWRRYYDGLVAPMLTDKPMPIDFRNERPLYGRVNARNDIIYVIPKEDYYKALPTKTGGHVRVLNFVADAFEDLQEEINIKVAKGQMSRRGKFAGITAEFGLLNVQKYYNNHLNILYSRFVGRYLEAEWGLAKQVKSFETFMLIFLKFMQREANRYPFTRTAFLSKSAMPPTISGLCIETHDVDFSEDFNKHAMFLNDTNYEVYRILARKFGFMLDRHAPWRLVADVTSPYMNKKMFQYGLSGSNIFSKYFVPSHVFDIDVMRVVLYNWYNQYVTSYPRHKKVETAFCKSAIFVGHGGKRTVPEHTARKRFKSSDEYDNLFGARYWLRQYLYIRLREVSAPVNEYEFNKIMRKVLTLYRVKSYNHAVKYIHAIAKKFQPNVIIVQDLGFYAGLLNNQNTK